MSAAPLRHSEIRGSQHAPAGRPRTSARRPDSLASGTQPFTADAKALLRLSADCRMASAAYAAEANKLDLQGSAVAEIAVDVARMAFQLQDAAQKLGNLAQDGEGLRILAARAAGATVTISEPLVVVGEEEHDAPASGHKLGVLARLTRRLGRLPVR